MAYRIIWRYRRKRHSPSAAASRRQERGSGTADIAPDGGRQTHSPERAHRRDNNHWTEEAPMAAVQFQEEEEAAQPMTQFQEEEEAQAKLQFQEEEGEEDVQAKLQFQEEEGEEDVQTKLQFQEEEGEEDVQTKLQFQEEEGEEDVQAKIQFQEEEGEEDVQAKIQFQEEEEEAVQQKPETVQKRSGRLIRAVARSGFRGHPGSYPFRHRIQAVFGHHNISSVRAFNDARANRANRRLGTLAYASRDRVAFRGYPDLHTAAHEAAHIIQQRQGVNLKDGAGRKGDPYERHADAVADRVVRGKSVESLLNRKPISDES